MKRNSHWMIRLLKSFLRLGFLLVEVGFAAEKSEKPYTALHAQQLYEDGLIGESEYARCLYGD